MDSIKTGNLISRLRKEKCLTQKQLGEILNVTDKTVSKWERGQSLPGVDILTPLAKVLGTTTDILLSGGMNESVSMSGMRRLKFYVCPDCGNIFTSMNEGDIYCHAKKLEPLKAKNAQGDDLLSVEKTDGEYLITSSHEMVKEHYISFVALVSYDSIILTKCYPEWHMNVRFPIKRGQLYHYCTEHGLYEQKI